MSLQGQISWSLQPLLSRSLHLTRSGLGTGCCPGPTSSCGPYKGYSTGPTNICSQGPSIR
ncbi:hypothetical protein DPMN_164436 [Dreissena polymorpha]|uniref:Uncharacterized protein n=1 Tax=Dreissena polymorpha TaxID=45954 RepID=A0A9D4EV85_DREPO|nr:hypothetical protein DPMN_164436 [Dreissena polymorpha]